MSPTVKNPTAASAGADWTNPNNAIVSDGAFAVNGLVGPGGGGHLASQMITTGYGFAIPSTAVIDGIILRAQVSSGFSQDSSIVLRTSVITSNDKRDFSQTWPVSEAWLSWGSPTDTWGVNWTPANINDSTFGGSVSAFPTHSTDTINVDSMQITVYWHIANQPVPKRYIYKVFDNLGNYLGNLPKVISEFSLQQDINTGGAAQMTIECAVSADTSRLLSDNLTDEAGNLLTDESSNQLTDEGQLPIVAPGNSGTIALIKNGNQIQVWEQSYYYPNGRCRFLGQMEKWEADFGGGSDTIKILCYHDGQDLDNYLVRANPYTYTGDVTQTASTGFLIDSTAGMGGGWDRFGQTWTVGGGVTNLGAISLFIDNEPTRGNSANVTVRVYADTTLNTLLGSVTQFVLLGSASEVQFQFPTLIKVTAGQQYFFTVETDAGNGINISYSNANPYSGGEMYESIYGGGGGGGYSTATVPGSDLYFKTFSGTGSTIGTFTSLDPTTGMLELALDDYQARGGLVTYDSTTIDPTGLTLSYTTNTNTTREFVDAILSLAPNGFYYFVDPGSDVMHFKQASTVADIVLTKGIHIEKLTLTATIENVKNQVYFSGGATAGVNLYKGYQDSASVAAYKVKLDRKSDNRVTLDATADAIGNSEIAELKDEDYQTAVTVLDKTMDIGLLRPGLIIGFAGFGTFADSILAQIVRSDHSPEECTLTLGILPVRLNVAFEAVTRGLIAQQTIANPSSPS